MKYESRGKGTRFFGAAASLFGSSDNEQILDAVPARAALIDATGRVRAVNTAWRSVPSGDDFFPQSFDNDLNYLDLCDATRGSNARAAWAIARGLRAVLDGSSTSFSSQYSWQFGAKWRAFKCMISPFGGRTFGSARGALVIHVDVDGVAPADSGSRLDLIDIEADAPLAARMELLAKEDPARGVGLVANAVPALLSYVDRDTTYRSVNSHYEKWFGAPASEIVGMSMAEVAGEALFRRIEPHVAKVLEGHRVTFEDTFEDGLGSQRWFRATYIPDIDGDGKVHGFCTLTYDITHLKEVETRLDEAKTAAEKCHRTQTEFLAHVGQELRSPLTSIVGFSQTLASELLGPIGDQYREYSKDIRDTACGLVELVSDLGDLSRIQSGQLVLEESRLDLGALIAASLSRVEAVAGEARVVLDIQKPSEAVGLFADERLVRMVVVNLLINGIRLANDGGKVGLSVRQEADRGLSVVVFDADLNLSQSDIERIAEPFGSLGRRHLPGTIGAGLALPLARHYMELHDGSLTLSRGATGGFTATATFPRARVVG
ncbi:MAG: PAS domain-containing sensor histidine kinase [Alphaproteobacteria bacterium]|nr:PAS domain-containing sensor histidine kinase [Alphaproteobacteria bacterium]